MLLCVDFFAFTHMAGGLLIEVLKKKSECCKGTLFDRFE